MCNFSVKLLERSARQPSYTFPVLLYVHTAFMWQQIANAGHRLSAQRRKAQVSAAYEHIDLKSQTFRIY